MTSELWTRCPDHGDMDPRLYDGSTLLCPFCKKPIECPGGLVRVPFDEAVERMAEYDKAQAYSATYPQLLWAALGEEDT